MPLIDVIKAVTITPAAAICRSEVIGSLSVPVAVWKDGVRFKTSMPHQFPNTTRLKDLAFLQDEPVIKDKN